MWISINWLKQRLNPYIPRFNPLFDDAMVTKVNISSTTNICDSLSDGAQTTSSTSSGYASHPSSNSNNMGENPILEYKQNWKYVRIQMPPPVNNIQHRQGILDVLRFWGGFSFDFDHVRQELFLISSTFLELNNVMGQQKYRWRYRLGGSRLQSYMHEKCNQCSARYNQNRKELNHSKQSEWVHFLMDACPKSPRMVCFVMDVLFKHFLSIWSHLGIPGKCFAYCRFLVTTRKGVAKVPRTLFAILKSYAVLGPSKSVPGRLA